MSTWVKGLLPRISKQVRDEKGQSLIIISFLFIGLVALVGLAIDLGTMYVQRTKLGEAIDAAALAAAQELPNEVGAWDRAEEYLRINGYNPTDASVTITYSFPDQPVHGYHYQIQIEATKIVPLSFLRVLGFNNVTVSARAIGENANRLDVVLVLDRTGTMADDTCYITRTDPQYACNVWLKNITNLFSDNFDSGLNGWTTNTHATWDSGGYVRLEGGTPAGEFTRQFSTIGRDVVKVTFRVSQTGMTQSSNDELQLIWRRGAGGTIQTAWYRRPPPGSWTQFQVELPTGAANIPVLVVGFRLRNTEAAKYAYIDDFTLDGANDGLGPYDGTGADNRCNGGGSQDCGASADPFLNYFHEQPIYDTLAAADGFLDYMDPDLDKIGLVSYSTSATINYELSSDFSAITSTLYSETAFNPSGCTNISDAIYAGVTALSTTSPHQGRTNAVHVMILLTDGWSNSWPGFSCACDVTGCPYDTCYEGTGQPWGRTLAAVQWAKNNSVIIFVIAQGACVNESLLKEGVAEETFGQYYHAVTTDQLAGIFQEIAQYLFLRLVR